MTSVRQNYWQTFDRNVSRFAVLFGIVFVFGLSTTANAGRSLSRKPVIDGYDVVALYRGKLIKGESRFSVRHDLRYFHFGSRESRRKFLQNPNRYTPVLNGDCAVCFQRSGVRVPGSVKFAARHKDRIYLFPSAKLRVDFQTNPTAYENTDLVADGNSIVWLAHHGRQVPGKPQYTVRYNGLRYQFASTADRVRFAKSPRPYVDFLATRSTRTDNGVVSLAPPPLEQAPSFRPTERAKLSALSVIQGQAPGQLQTLSAFDNGLTPQLNALRVLEAAGRRR